MLKKIITHLLIILSYCLLASLFTYPLIFNLNNLIENKLPFFVSFYSFWPKIDISAANIVWLTCLVISGYLAYLIAESQLKNKIFAWGAGILFAFSFYNLNSWDNAKEIILKLIILPLYILLWIKYFDKNKVSYFYLNLFLLIIFSYTQYAIALSALFIGIVFLIRNKNKINIKIKIIALIVIFLLTLLFSFIQNISAYKINEGSKIIEQINNSITISELFTPFHKFGDHNHFACIGIITIILILFSFKKWREKEWRLWLFITSLFLILSFGPFLKTLNIVDPRIPLPYLFIFQYFPFSVLMVKPYNFFIIAQLGLSILAMYGISNFLGKNTKSIYKYSLVLILLIIINWETSSLPQTFNTININSYYKKIAEEKNNKNILEISDENKLQSWTNKYANIKYNINILNTANANTALPIFSELFFTGEKRSVIKHNYGLIGPGILNTYNIGYVNFNKNYSNNYLNGEKFLKKYFSPILVYENKEEKIYKLNNTDNDNKYYLQIDPLRWSYLKKTKNNSYKNARDDASLKIYNYDQKYIDLNISMEISSETDQKIKLYLDNQVLEQQIISPETKNITINLKKLAPGEHNLRFHLNEKIKVYSIEY